MAGFFGSGWTYVCGDFFLLQSDHICNITVQRPADTQQRFHADMLALPMLAIIFVVKPAESRNSSFLMPRSLLGQGSLPT
jgi:hypothetical protein